MYRLKEIDIYASEIAEYLEYEMTGRDFIVHRPCSFSNLVSGSFAIAKNQEKLILPESSGLRDILFIVSEPMNSYPPNFSIIVSPSPMIDFLRVLNEFFTEKISFSISPSVKISPSARLAQNISIGENVVIGPEVSIGENTEIFNNVVIQGQVMIGENCIVKDNATIGRSGYNFVTDEKGVPLLYPNIGKIIIGNDVWIGSNSSIESASLDNTTIHDHVKIDDLVHIGYNSTIGERSMITAGVIVSRNVTIGNECTLLPNSTIRENIRIGDQTIVGMGSVVISDLESHSVYVGNPAHLLKSNQ